MLNDSSLGLETMNLATMYNLSALFKLVASEFTESTTNGIPVYSGDDACRTACCMIGEAAKAIDRSEDVQRFLFKSGVAWPVSIDRIEDAEGQ
jgi:hypothetical protein